MYHSWRGLSREEWRDVSFHDPFTNMDAPDVARKRFIKYEKAFVGGDVSLGGASFTQNVDDTISLVDSALVFDRGLGLSDSFTLIDTLSFDRGLSLADTLALADSIAFGIGLEIDDTLALADAISEEIGRTVTIDDVLSLADALNFDRGLGLSDSITLTDVLNFAREIVLSDNLNLADALAFDRGLLIADSVPLADQLVFNFGLSIQDSLTLADLIDPVLTQGGGTAWLVNINDTILLVDARTFSGSAQFNLEPGQIIGNRIIVIGRF